MARMHFYDLGKFGIYYDLDQPELPPTALSTALTSNARMQDNYVTGPGQQATIRDSLTVTPNKLFYVPWGTKKYWVFCSNTDVGVWDPSVTPSSGLYNISKSATPGTSYTGTFNDQWNGCWLNGIFVLNNGVDVPQYWSNGDTATRLQNLSNWPSGWRAKVLRSYKNFLLALNVTKSGVNYASTLTWSHPADPGTPPVTWDITDSTKLAGDVSLAGTPGKLVDSVNLREANVIYKEDSIILQQYIGGNDIFSFRELSNATGLMGQNCAVEFKPGFHFCLTKDGDAIVHNGQTIESVASGKIQKLLRQSFSINYADRSFVIAHPQFKEVWVVPFSYEESYPDWGAVGGVFVWNWESGAWGYLDYSFYGFNDLASGEYDSTVGSTETKTPRIVAADAANDALVLVSTESTYGETPFYELSYVYQDGLAISGQAADGSPRVDYNQHLLVTEIWPKIDLAEGSEVIVTIAGADTKEELTGTSNYQTITYDPATSDKIDCWVEGKYIAITWEIYAYWWRFYGYGLEVTTNGEYS